MLHMELAKGIKIACNCQRYRDWVCEPAYNQGLCCQGGEILAPTTTNPNLQKQKSSLERRPRRLCQSQSTPIQMPEMPDTQQHKGPHETHLTNSVSEDNSSSATEQTSGWNSGWNNVQRRGLSFFIAPYILSDIQCRSRVPTHAVCGISPCDISLTYGSTKKFKHTKSKCIYSHKLSVNIASQLNSQLAIDQSTNQVPNVFMWPGITLINTIWVVIPGCCPLLKSNTGSRAGFHPQCPQQSCLSLISASVKATTLHQKQQGRSNPGEEHSHQLLLCLQPHWWVGDLVLHARLEGNWIVLILCFIVTHMYSNLFTMFGLIWWLEPPKPLVLK